MPDVGGGSGMPNVGATTTGAGMDMTPPTAQPPVGSSGGPSGMPTGGSTAGGSGMPMMPPMMGGAGAGAGAGTGGNQDRERSTWLTEDGGAWFQDESEVAPPVLGREA